MKILSINHFDSLFIKAGDAGSKSNLFRAIPVLLCEVLGKFFAGMGCWIRRYE